MIDSTIINALINDASSSVSPIIRVSSPDVWAIHTRSIFFFLFFIKSGMEKAWKKANGQLDICLRN